MRARLPLVLSCALLIAPARQGAAQAGVGTTTGPTFCIDCHDHQRERRWWQDEDGPPPAGHIQALRQLDSPKAAAYARAVGLGRATAPGSTCLPCHATLVRGEPVAGVSCESCHGPGRGYLVPHQDKGAYQRAVAAGMFDTREKPDAWVRLCVQCHVIRERKLVAAGHPSGDRFETAVAMKAVVHWKATPAPQAVAAAERSARKALLETPLPVTSPSVARPAGDASGAPAERAVVARPAPDGRVAQQDDALALAASLLASGGGLPPGVAAPGGAAPADPFLRLQADVLRLALDALAARGAAAGTPR
jgi:hypothetical protein